MGTCQGFELLMYIVSQYYPVLSAVTQDVDVYRPLENVDLKAESIKIINANLLDVLIN
jgi:hypothetical protein